MPETHLVKCKCLACSLHFIAFSHGDEWLPHFCPECGQHSGSFIVWRETSDDFIFQHVPGHADLVAMGGFPAAQFADEIKHG